MDSDDLLLVSIKETVKNPNAPPCTEEGASGSEDDLSEGGENSVAGTDKKFFVSFWLS